MWLSRIDIVRYGGLSNVSLEPLGPGLNVVYGPNEAGKSTVTALIRHVLYGFPGRRHAERTYHVEGAGRHGRLVFTAGDDEWVVERREGKSGGPVVVTAVRGPERPRLHEDLTRGVSVEAYRVVFGFGLEDMAKIVRSEDEVVSRLYAASAGVAVSPHDVSKSLTERMEQLFKPSGRTPAINVAAKQAADAQHRLRELVRAAEALDMQRAERASLEHRVKELATAVARALESSDTVTAQARELQRIEEALLRAREELAEIDIELARARVKAELPPHGARVIDSAPLIEALVSEVGAHRDRMQRTSDARQRADGVATRIQSLVGEAGLDVDAAETVTITAEVLAGIDRFRDLLARSEASAADARRASAAAKAALDAHRSLSLSERAKAKTRPRALAASAFLAALGGVVSIVLGALTDSWPLVGTGIIVAAAGAYLAHALSGVGPGDHGDRGRSEMESRLAYELERASAFEADAKEEHAAVRAEWDSWRVERGLEHVSTPIAAGRAVEALREYGRVVRESKAAERALEDDVAAIEGFVARAGEIAAALSLADRPSTPDEAPLLVAQMAEMLAKAREAESAAAVARENIERLVPRRAGLEQRERELTARAREISKALGVEDGRVDEASVRAQEAQREAATARDHYESLRQELAHVRGAIEAAETETEAGAARLSITGAHERLKALAEEYAVLRVAQGMLAEAQQVYERERQPEVVREAGRVLEAFTTGKYPAVRIPLGTTGVTLRDASGRTIGLDLLSTGTAEQLYLALRVALLGALGDVGAKLPVLMDDVFANFDHERKRGAARVVAELARRRQVIVFTCHAETRSLFEEVAPGVTSLEIGR